MMKSIYTRQFLLMSLIILLSFSLLGGTFVGLSSRSTISEREDVLQRNAETVATMTGGLVGQGRGTSMLQMGNIVKKPVIWLPPIITSAITGALATVVFRMENPIAVASGMGTCGLVGPIGVLSAKGLNEMDILAVLLICFVLPAVLTWIIAKSFKKLGIIKDSDLKLDI